MTIKNDEWEVVISYCDLFKVIQRFHILFDETRVVNVGSLYATIIIDKDEQLQELHKIGVALLEKTLIV